MLPPIDPATLERNPKFKTLYRDLSENKLNADASTKDVKRQRPVDQARKGLIARRTELAKTQILKSSLDALSARAADLPDELLEVITIVAALINGRIPSSEREILREDVEYFTEHIEPTLRALSGHVQGIALQLCRIAGPEESPSALPSLIPDLPAIVSEQQHDSETATVELAEQRTRLADLAASVLEAQAKLMDVVVRMLEQTMHGSVARGLKAKAEHLAAVAKGLELKMSILTLTNTPPTSLTSALSNYTTYLSSEKAELQHRQVIAEDRLRAFEEAGGQGRGSTMREIARHYTEVEEEISKVQAAVGRLEGK